MNQFVKSNVMITKKTCFVLWIISIIGNLSVFPYVYFLGLLPKLGAKELAYWLIQPSVFFGIVCWLGYLLSRKVDLRPFSIEKPIAKQIIIPGVIVGILVGGALVVLEKTVFQHSVMAQTPAVPLWARMLASIYGGFNEEVLCRFFLLTLIYFLLVKMFQKAKGRNIYLLSVATVIAALIFAAGHLPALYKMIPSPPLFETTRVIVLNTFAGVVFGWVYCTRGFWAAATAHFTTDLVIHVIF